MLNPNVLQEIEVALDKILKIADVVVEATAPLDPAAPIVSAILKGVDAVVEVAPVITEASNANKSS